jgi:hypothetical protein
MPRRSLVAGLGLLIFLAPASPLRAEVSVKFVEPRQFTDTGAYGYDSEHNLRALERHLKTLGGRCLKAGETLEVQVFDVDLAGRNEWWHSGAYDLRVMREITWPRVELGYLRRDAAGAVLAEGREQVADMNYLWRSAYVRHDRDALPYEKAMLRDWFERRFCRDAGELSAH